MNINSPKQIDFISGKLYHVSVVGGDVDIQRYRHDGTTLVTVPGSPILDGEEKLLRTFSENGKILVTPSAALEFNMVAATE
tara:strand:+ start:232 stop:474 length:243 start_codon:yes stop_codon:yes gene_type:complete